jgi:DNA-binding GntR family transcriptional regulator
MQHPDGLQYLGVRDDIAARIAGGEFKAGERLPSERNLQVGGGVARGTIREALFQLEAEGHLSQGPQRLVRLAAAGGL